jgi:hypothetical protein
MRNFPLPAFVLLIAFSTNTLSAQTGTNTIKSSNNGKLNYSYSVINNNQYILEVIIKNDQFIYKQEIDTLKIQSAEAFSLLKQDLQNALTALQNVNPNFKIERSNYLLFAEDKGVTGLFMVLSNSNGMINTANNKFQTKVFFEWLNTIEFGKS